MSKAKKTEKVLKPIFPNAGIEAAYRRAMQGRARAMSIKYEEWLLLTLRKEPSVTVITDLMEGLARHWQSEFDGIAEAMAYKFGTDARLYTDFAMKRELKRAGWALEFSMTENEKQAFEKVVAWNVGLIKTIPEQYHDRVQNAVFSTLTTEGSDLYALKERLKECYNITDRRAAFIAKDQNNKAHSAFENARRLDLGLTEAEWMHSKAGKYPREPHVKAGEEKRRYDIRNGCLIDGKYIQPGEEINCRCVSLTVIPGLGV